MPDVNISEHDARTVMLELKSQLDEVLAEGDTDAALNGILEQVPVPA